MVQMADEGRWIWGVAALADNVVEQRILSDPHLCELLLSTGDALIAEADPDDYMWGIGLCADDPRVEDPPRWPGGNLLGDALVGVRAMLWFRRSHEVKSSGPFPGRWARAPVPCLYDQGSPSRSPEKAFPVGDELGISPRGLSCDIPGSASLACSLGEGASELGDHSDVESLGGGLSVSDDDDEKYQAMVSFIGS